MTNFAKLIVALVLLVAVVVVAAQDLAPNIAYAKLFAFIFIGFVALTVILVGLIWIYFNIDQWVLRKGGTDTAWFWFSSETKGLMALRERLKKLIL